MPWRFTVKYVYLNSFKGKLEIFLLGLVLEHFFDELDSFIGIKNLFINPQCIFFDHFEVKHVMDKTEKLVKHKFYDAQNLYRLGLRE